MSIRNFPLGLVLLVSLVCFSCKKNRIDDYQGYPEEIVDIFIASCATSGCHNNISAAAAGGLSMESWDKLFEGSRGGSTVVPFSSTQSFLLFFINTDTSLGISLSPTMPFGSEPLSPAQYLLVKEWIENGAPDCNGVLPFPDDPSRRKWYVANQGCDLVSVFDAESNQVMRYIDVGILDGFVEAPHMIRVSPDGKYWYVVFLASNPYMRKYSTLNDSLVADIEIGVADWNTFSISSDGKYGYAIGLGARQVAIVDLELETLVETAFLPKAIHGSHLNGAEDKLYITHQDESSLTWLSFTASGEIDEVDEVDLIQGVAPSTSPPLWPHEVIFTPDGTKYLVSCQRTNEVRVLNAANDSLLAVIETGGYPSEFAISESRNLCFVSCMEDVTTFAADPSKRGSIAVIDLATLTLQTAVYSGYQPHGLAVDETAGLLVVGNRNTLSDGPAPHHSTECGGRNGYVSFIDLDALELVDGNKYEVSVDPYSVAVKH